LLLAERTLICRNRYSRSNYLSRRGLSPIAISRQSRQARIAACFPEGLHEPSPSGPFRA
jgi:hypothetical protein